MLVGNVTRKPRSMWCSLLGQAVAFPPEVGQESLRAGRPLPASYPDLRAGGPCVPSAAGTLGATVQRVRVWTLTV